MKAIAKKFKVKDFVNYAIVLAALVIFLLLDLTGGLKLGIKSLLVTLIINVILAVSLNLLVGFLGELTLGHAGFMCIGAFIGKWVSLQIPNMPTILSLPICLISGGIMAAIFGFIIGLPTMRLRGDYLAIVTLAFGEIIRSVFLNLPEEVFGGAQGLKGGAQDTTYVICFIVLLVALIIIQNFVNSRHGRAIRAIRNNDIAARSIGINVTYYKLMVFIIAAFFAGVAGVLYSHNIYVLQSSAFSYNKSIEILVFVVLGGMGSITGSIIAATVVTVLPEAMRFLLDYRMLIYSIVLIAIMLSNASPKFRAFMDKVKGFFKKYLDKAVQSIKKKFVKMKNKNNGKEDN